VRTLLGLILDGLLAGAAHGAEEEESVDLVLPFSTVSRQDWAESVHLWCDGGLALLNAQAVRTCPACGDRQSRQVFYSYDGYPYAECVACDCLYVPKWVDYPLFKRFLSSRPRAQEISDRALNKRSSAENLDLDVARIGQYLARFKGLLSSDARSANYLDIGASTGSSLIAATQMGLQGVGLEVNENSAAVARKRGLTVYSRPDSLPAGSFELISFWESLEHIADPHAALVEAAARLQPGGLLALTIPNAEAPIVKIMRGDCSFVAGGTDSPGHINMFGPKQLERLLDRAGFDLIHLDGQYGVDYVEIVGYVLGRHRGARSLLNAQRAQYTLPANVVQMLRSAGPAISFVERASLRSPILFAVATKHGDPAKAELARQKLKSQRDGELAEEEKRLADGLPDILARGDALQAEIDRRDELLNRLQASANELQSTLGKMQEEVNLRDAMLRRLSGFFKSD